MVYFWTAFAMVGLAVVIQLIAGSLDRERIECYLRQNGWELVDKSWKPFGPGWYGAAARIYEIVYRDEHGNMHEVFVKTSMFGGVYLTNDYIVEHADTPKADSRDSLESENQQLKNRLKQLEEQLNKSDTGEGS